MFLAARQNLPTSAALFEAMQPDALLVPTEVVAHEVYAQLSTPLLWRFIQRLPAEGDAWAEEVIRRLRFSCGHRLPALWKVRLDADQAPALQPLLASGEVRLGDLLRSPEDRERRLKVVPLLLLHERRGRADPGRGRRARRGATSCCSRGTPPSGARWSARWWWTRVRRTCCRTGGSRPAGSGAGWPGPSPSASGPRAPSEAERDEVGSRRG